MKRTIPFLFIVCLMILAGCSTSPTGPNAPGWVKVGIAPWAGRHFLSGTVFNNQMWVIGGLSSNNDASVTQLYHDVWSTGNGASWSETNSNAPFGNRYGHRVLSYNGQMYLIGGNNRIASSGDILRNDVWRSNDGITWTNILPNASIPGPNQFSPRMDFGAEVFNGSMWIIGGFTGNAQNDVWNSIDGITWNLVLASSPTNATHFDRRWGHSTVVYNGNLWVIGGATGNLATPAAFGYSDVWNSPDGITWTKVYNGYSFGPLYYHQTVANNNQIWMTGGWGWPTWGPRALTGITTDGINWTSTSSIPWEQRFYHLSLAFNGSVYIMGGMDNNGARVFFNDVWRSP